jgi:hypothetical protein
VVVVIEDRVNFDRVAEKNLAQIDAMVSAGFQGKLRPQVDQGGLKSSNIHQKRFGSKHKGSNTFRLSPLERVSRPFMRFQEDFGRLLQDREH